MINENEIVLNNVINDLCKPRSGKIYHEDQKSPEEILKDKPSILEHYNQFKERYLLKFPYIFKYGTSPIIIEDFKNFEEINKDLHRMVEIEKNDNGMRKCPYRFSVTKIGPRINRMVAANIVFEREYNMEKDDKYLFLIKREIKSDQETNKKQETRTMTIPFQIDKVNTDIRSHVMGWFE